MPFGVLLIKQNHQVDIGSRMKFHPAITAHRDQGGLGIGGHLQSPRLNQKVIDHLGAQGDQGGDRVALLETGLKCRLPWEMAAWKAGRGGAVPLREAANCVGSGILVRWMVGSVMVKRLRDRPELAPPGAGSIRHSHPR